MADTGNDRIMKWTTNYLAGGVCLVGCTGSSGPAPNQFSGARDLKFDQYGNLYVSDQRNNRVQKFMIQRPISCPIRKSSIFLIFQSKSIDSCRWWMNKLLKSLHVHFCVCLAEKKIGELMEVILK